MKKTFTLIEMLIVIVIIGILAAALIPRLQSVQGRARDTKRKTDFTQIHNALLIYNTDNGWYPQSSNISGSCALNANCYRYSLDGAPWISAISGYMTSIPVDPINNGLTPWGTAENYSYAYGNIWLQQKTFILISKLENPSDGDRCAIQEYKLYINWTVLNCKNTGSCGTYCPNLYVRSDTAGN